MFNESFKYYKQKQRIPDFTNVVDFDRLPCVPNVCECNLDSSPKKSIEVPPGIKSVDTWKVYTLTAHAGLIVIRNPFTVQGQRYWLARCLRDYPRYPNAVNLNGHLFPPTVIKDWWLALGELAGANERKHLKSALRWATLGYHHDWNSKVYTEDNRSVFPSDLGKLSKFFADVLGYESFDAQAAIINYYPIGTTLAGHTDHSEVNLSAPLFSLSFGQTAIFLIGGQNKEEKPTALFLKSGDVLVMSGQSRLCYHAVPRVGSLGSNMHDEHNHYEVWNEHIEIPLNNSNESQLAIWNMDAQLFQRLTDNKFWAPFQNYLKDARINMNIRQVLHNGKDHLA